jgi:LacI family transcriptional regulator
MRATIKDIAEECKVSVGTVDRALNDRPGISKKTKEKILEAAERLQYRPNYIGQSLARGKTMTIGVVCFDLYNNFFPELIDTIESRAKEQGYFIYLILTHRDFKLEQEGLRYLYERQVDGIILFPIGVNQEYIEFLKSLKIPIVTLYNKLNDSFPFVGVDDKSAMRDAVEFLAKKGYTSITYLTPDMEVQERMGLNTYTLRQRAAGYLNGIEKCRIKDYEILDRGNMEEKLDYFVAKHAGFSEKTAILCLCDSYAIRAMNYLEEKGIRVPEQVGIMGYDNIDQLKYIQPKIATIEYSVLRMGQAAIDILLECIPQADSVKECMLNYKIIDGNSLN